MYQGPSPSLPHPQFLLANYLAPRSCEWFVPCTKFKILGIEVAQVYTSIMASLPPLPVLSKFNCLQEPSDGPILPWALYLLCVEKTNPILFPNTINFMPGTVVQYDNQLSIKYEIKGKLISHYCYCPYKINV